VAMAVYLVLSLGIWFLANDTDTQGFDVHDWFRLFAPMALAGISSFKLLWADTVVPVIEEKTSPPSEPKP